MVSAWHIYQIALTLCSQKFPSTLLLKLRFLFWVVKYAKKVDDQTEATELMMKLKPQICRRVKLFGCVF